MLTKLLAWIIALAGVIAFCLIYVTAPSPAEDADVLYAGSIFSSDSRCVLLRPSHPDPTQRRLEGTCDGIFRISFDPDGAPDLVGYAVSSHTLRRCASGSLNRTPVRGLPEFAPVTRCFSDAPAPPPQGP